MGRAKRFRRARQRNAARNAIRKMGASFAQSHQSDEACHFWGPHRVSGYQGCTPVFFEHVFWELASRICWNLIVVISLAAQTVETWFGVPVRSGGLSLLLRRLEIDFSSQSLLLHALSRFFSRISNRLLSKPHNFSVDWTVAIEA